MDLRVEFDKILNDDGHYVLMQRGSRKARCICWNDRAREGDPNCPRCGGEGWLVRLERHKVRQKIASQPVSHPGQASTTEVGRLATPAAYFYMRHDAHPQVSDLIYVVGWKDSGLTVPANVVEVYRLNFAEPRRGDRGRIEQYVAAGRLIALDKPMKQITMQRLAGNKRTYEPRF